MRRRKTGSIQIWISQATGFGPHPRRP